MVKKMLLYGIQIWCLFTQCYQTCAQSLYFGLGALNYLRDKNTVIPIYKYAKKTSFTFASPNIFIHYYSPDFYLQVNCMRTDEIFTASSKVTNMPYFYKFIGTKINDTIKMCLYCIEEKYMAEGSKGISSSG